MKCQVCSNEINSQTSRYSKQAAAKNLQPEVDQENRRKEAGTDYSAGEDYNYVYDEEVMPDIGDFDHDHRLVGGEDRQVS